MIELTKPQRWPAGSRLECTGGSSAGGSKEDPLQFQMGNRGPGHQAGRGRAVLLPSALPLRLGPHAGWPRASQAQSSVFRWGCFWPQGAECPASGGLQSTDIYFSGSLEGGGVGLDAASQTPSGSWALSTLALPSPGCGLVSCLHRTPVAPVTTSDHGIQGGETRHLGGKSRPEPPGRSPLPGYWPQGPMAVPGCKGASLVVLAFGRG